MSQIIKFDKIVPEGKAMGRLKDGRAVFCIGPLPGEVAEVALKKQKRTYAEAVLKQIMEPSDQRSGSSEDHSLSCSPWQDVDYDYQLELKQEMLKEAFSQHQIGLPSPRFVKSPQQFGYRNRLDFTLGQDGGNYHLAFHRRGSWDTLTPLPDGCRLGSERMNQAALALTAELNRTKFKIDSGLITVREAGNELITILTTPADNDWKQINTSITNLIVARPLPGSGAPGETIFTSGNTFITEELRNMRISYPYNSFFQTNVQAFSAALDSITEAAGGFKRIVELYSGVGAIGIPLASQGGHVYGIEIVEAAVEFAERNARTNQLENYQAWAVPAEKMDSSVLQNADCVIIDPPRAGIHPRVAGWLTAAAPERIIYLSCNPVTQARDLASLKEKYAINSVTGYDFYPGALHLESLAILDRI